MARTHRTPADYADIIDLPHHESRNHPRMSADKRAAQFSPFAALTGYEDEVDKAVQKKEDDLDDRHNRVTYGQEGWIE